MAKASTFQAPAKATPPKKDAKKLARGGGTASPWLDKIDTALQREEKAWRVAARNVVMRYRDERGKGGRVEVAGSIRLNMLWANTEIMKAALLPRLPKPDVRRRFPDGKSGNSAARVAAEVIERSLAFVVDTEDTEYVLASAIEDYLLPGRGVVWVSYDPEIEEPEEDDKVDNGSSGTPSAAGVAPPALPGGVSAEPGGTPSPGSAAPSADETPAEQEGEVIQPTPTGGRIISQRLRFQYVYWEDYCEGQARQDSEVPWKARRHALSKEEFATKFPDAKKDTRTRVVAAATYKLTDASDRRGLFNDDDYVELWEVWAKGARQRLWLARGYADLLEPAGEDPYELTNFYPCPRPIRSVTTTDRQVPVPEYLLWEDQSIELDRVTTRLHSLTEQLKFRGIYDSSIPDGQAPGSSILATVARQEDGVFLGHPSFNVIAGKGGIDAVFGVLPLDGLLKVIPVLAERRGQLIEEIYQITGISDIVRGSTDPNETKGAQVLKAQFGSLRMSSRKREVQRFVRDFYRIGAELIAEHYTQETLAQITGFDLPTDEEKQMLQAKVDQLQASAEQLQQMDAQSQGGAPDQGGAPPGLPPPGPPGQAQLPPPGAPPPPEASPAAPVSQDAMPAGMEGAPMPSPQGGPPQGGTPDAFGGLMGDTGDGQPPMQMPQLPMAQEASGGAPSEAPPEPGEIPAEVRERLAMPTWEDVMAILRSDKLRGYRTDVETDESSMEDQDAEKQRRVEAVAGMKDMLEASVMAASVNPKLVPLYKELTLFALRTFKPARSMEQAVEDAFDELMRNPPPPPQDSSQAPSDGSAEAKMAEVQLKSQQMSLDYALNLKRFKLDTVAKKTELDQKAAKDAADQQLAADKMQKEADDRAAELLMKKGELDLKRQDMADRRVSEARKTDFEKQKHADTQALDTRKHDEAMNLQKEAKSFDMQKHHDTMNMQKETSARDHSLKAAAHNKSMVDESSGETSPAEPGPLKVITDALAEVLRAVQQSQEDTAAAVEALNRPKVHHVQRDAKGKIALVKTEAA